MTFQVNFCEGCPFAGKCPPQNEAWAGPMMAGSPGTEQPVGIAVSWQTHQDFVPEGQEPASTPNVNFYAPPANQRWYTKQEYAEAVARGAGLVDACEKPGLRPLIKLGKWVLVSVRTCEAFNVASHEPVNIVVGNFRPIRDVEFKEAA